MKMKHYHEAQNEQWHEQYLNTEKLLYETECALCKLEHLALQHISDETVRADIGKIVNGVFKGVKHGGES